MRMRTWMDRWGYYCLAALCAGVILFSAVWTRNTQRLASPGAQALSDQSQRLADVTPPPTARPLHSPCGGPVIAGFSHSPVFFPESGVWRTHPAVNYQAGAGEEVFALLDGTAHPTQAGLTIMHADGSESRYRGLLEITVNDGQAVKAGQPIGKAGAWVPFEGRCVCVTVYRDGEAVDYSGQ